MYVRVCVYVTCTNLSKRMYPCHAHIVRSEIHLERMVLEQLILLEDYTPRPRTTQVNPWIERVRSVLPQALCQRCSRQTSRTPRGRGELTCWLLRGTRSERIGLKRFCPWCPGYSDHCTGRCMSMKCPHRSRRRSHTDRTGQHKDGSVPDQPRRTPPDTASSKPPSENNRFSHADLPTGFGI